MHQAVGLGNFSGKYCNRPAKWPYSKRNVKQSLLDKQIVQIACMTGMGLVHPYDIVMVSYYLNGTYHQHIPYRQHPPVFKMVVFETPSPEQVWVSINLFKVFSAHGWNSTKAVNIHSSARKKDNNKIRLMSSKIVEVISSDGFFLSGSHTICYCDPIQHSTSWFIS